MSGKATQYVWLLHTYSLFPKLCMPACVPSCILMSGTSASLLQDPCNALQEQPDRTLTSNSQCWMVDIHLILPSLYARVHALYFTDRICCEPLTEWSTLRTCAAGSQRT